MTTSLSHLRSITGDDYREDSIAGLEAHYEKLRAALPDLLAIAEAAVRWGAAVCNDRGAEVCRPDCHVHDCPVSMTAAALAAAIDKVKP